MKSREDLWFYPAIPISFYGCFLFCEELFGQAEVMTWIRSWLVRWENFHTILEFLLLPTSIESWPQLGFSLNRIISQNWCSWSKYFCPFQKIFQPSDIYPQVSFPISQKQPFYHDILKHFNSEQVQISHLACTSHPSTSMEDNPAIYEVPFFPAVSCNDLQNEAEFQVCSRILPLLMLT